MASRPSPVAEGPVLDLEHYAPALLTFLANKLSRGANALYRRRFGVSVTEWRVLALLAIEPGISAARICQVIGLDKGPTSRCLAALARRGLVRIGADPLDGRRRMVTLSGAGRALHDRVLPVALERERRLLACLDVAERETLLLLLNRLHANLAEVDRPLAAERV